MGEAHEKPHVPDVCARLGMFNRHRRWGPCPACHEDHTGDGRAPIRAAPLAWWCNACLLHGDGYDLVSWYMLGRPGSEAGSDFRRVVAWLDGTDAVETTRPEPEREPPPRDEIVALFRMARRAHEDPEVADYLRSRGVARPSMAPAWALPRDFGAKWWPRVWSSTYRLVVPAWGPHGQVRSMHARAVCEANPKSRWPMGCSSGAVLFADAPGRAMLRDPCSAVGIGRVIVAEGLTDFVSAAASAAAEGMRGSAVLGIENGSEPALRLVRLPANVKVYVATHADAAGDRYADAVSNALAPNPCRRVPLDLIRRRA